jgi:hypothetical protein
VDAVATIVVLARSQTNFGKLLVNKAENWVKVIPAVYVKAE